MNKLAAEIEVNPTKAKRTIRSAFLEAGCRRSKAAAALGIGERTLYEYERRLGLKEELDAIREKERRAGRYVKAPGPGRPPGSKDSRPRKKIARRKKLDQERA